MISSWAKWLWKSAAVQAGAFERSSVVVRAFARPYQVAFYLPCIESLHQQGFVGRWRVAVQRSTGTSSISSRHLCSTDNGCGIAVNALPCLLSLPRRVSVQPED